MTNQKAIQKARKLLLPVAESLAKRCPARMAKSHADTALASVRLSISSLSAALVAFEIADGRRYHGDERVGECGA